MEEELKLVDKFIITKTLLGKGSFGTVYKGFFKDNHAQLVAVKIISLEKVT